MKLDYYTFNNVMMVKNEKTPEVEAEVKKLLRKLSYDMAFMVTSREYILNDSIIDYNELMQSSQHSSGGRSRKSKAISAQMIND